MLCHNRPVGLVLGIDIDIVFHDVALVLTGLAWKLNICRHYQEEDRGLFVCLFVLT